MGAGGVWVSVVGPNGVGCVLVEIVKGLVAKGGSGKLITMLFCEVDG
jgi:hypothetical protein